MDDVRAVMDAVGSSALPSTGRPRAAAMSILFAATYPERTAALVVRSAYPRRMWAPDYPWGRPRRPTSVTSNATLQVFGPREQGRASVKQLGQFTDSEADSFLQMLRFGSSPGGLVALTG